MADCGACVYSGDIDIAPVFSRSFRRAAKEHTCSECGTKITKGERHEYVSMMSDGVWESFRTCLVCEQIRAAFSCDGIVYGGMFWEFFSEVLPELNSSCFDRLQTPEAKAELRRRWMEWKGLAA